MITLLLNDKRKFKKAIKDKNINLINEYITSTKHEFDFEENIYDYCVWCYKYNFIEGFWVLLFDLEGNYNKDFNYFLNYLYSQDNNNSKKHNFIEALSESDIFNFTVFLLAAKRNKLDILKVLVDNFKLDRYGNNENYCYTLIEHIEKHKNFIPVLNVLLKDGDFTSYFQKHSKKYYDSLCQKLQTEKIQNF